MTTNEAKHALNRFIKVGFDEFTISDPDIQEEWLGYVTDVNMLIRSYDNHISYGELEFINNSVENLQYAFKRIGEKCGDDISQDQKDYLNEFSEALNILKVADDPKDTEFFESIFKKSN